MHKVKELEEQWLSYKMKKFILPAIKVSSLYLLIVGSYYIYMNKGEMLLNLMPSNAMTKVLGVSMDANNTEVSNSQMAVLKDEPIKEEKIIEVPQTVETATLEKMTLVPIIPVIDMEKEVRIPEVKRYKTVKHSKAVRAAEKHTVTAKRNNYLTAKELAVITKKHKKEEAVSRKTKKMHFTSSSNNYIEMMKQKFAKSNTSRDALLLAKTYYKNKNYRQAEAWALSANKLNNNLEESWLLFAKSKVKLGKKQEALKILVSYSKRSHSVKAKGLIGQIKTGQF